MRKIIGIDIETTGLDCKRHGIIQIGMFIEIDGKLVNTLLVNVQPFDLDMVTTIDGDISYGDLIISDRITEEYEFLPSKIKLKEIYSTGRMQALKQIIAFLDKHVDKFDKADKAYLMGFNLQFDMGFITEWFRKLDFKYFGSYTNYRPLDAYHEACYDAFKGELDMLENLKLETLCKHYGIEIEAHNALSDILAMRQLWYRITAGVGV